MNLLPKLKDDWRQALKWLQTQLGLAIVAAPTLYVLFPQYIKPYVSEQRFAYLMAVLGVLVILNAIRAKTPAP